MKQVVGVQVFEWRFRALLRLRCARETAAAAKAAPVARRAAPVHIRRVCIAALQAGASLLRCAAPTALQVGLCAGHAARWQSVPQ